MNEISRGMCNQGNYHLHSTFSNLAEQAEQEFIVKCVQPDEIVKYIKNGLNADEFTKEVPNDEEQKSDTIPTSAPLSQMARANALIKSFI